MKKQNKRTDFEVLKLAHFVFHSNLTERQTAEKLGWTFNEVRNIKSSKRFKRLYQQVLESAQTELN